MKTEENVTYRASIGALIVDSRKRFLLTELIDAKPKECDFVKGGRRIGETELQTLNREIGEELGNDFEYEVIKKSNWNVIYEWPKELQDRLGYCGQARTSYWVRYKTGDITLAPGELRAYYWVEEHELYDCLKASNFNEFYIKSLLLEWDILNNNYSELFN
ncbi:MAG: NUDIX domain-containing protein [bacterium]